MWTTAVGSARPGPPTCSPPSASCRTSSPQPARPPADRGKPLVGTWQTGSMPELPEVESLAAFLREHAVGHAVARADAASFSVLKTFDPPLTALTGQVITDVGRHGKFLDLSTDQGLHLITPLARAGWLRWRDDLPTAPPKPGKSPLAFRLRLDDGSGFDLT